MDRQSQAFADHSQWATLPLKRKNHASGQSTPENDDGKRVRMRYSKEEEEKLIREVIKRWDELYGAKSRFLPWGRKTSTWSEIAAQLGETSKGARAGEDVRKKWLYMKRVFMDKVEAQRASAHTDSGPAVLPQLTPLEQKLLSLLKQPPVQPCNVPDIGAPRMDMSTAETDGMSSGSHPTMGFFSPTRCSGVPGETDVNRSHHPVKTARGHSSYDLATDELSCSSTPETQVLESEPSAVGIREDDLEDERTGQSSDQATPTSRNLGRSQSDDSAPVMAAIVNRQRLSMSVQMEAVKVLRRLVGDVHRYIEHITLTGASMNMPATLLRENDSPPTSAPSTITSIPIQLALLHDDILLERFHFDRSTIAYLCTILRSHISNNWMQVEGTVCTALAFYATGTFQSPVGESFEIDQAVVKNIVELVSDALVTVSDQFIKFPTSVQNQVQQDFLSIAGFPGVVGALGCTHIAIRRPEISPNLYLNRKQFYSMNLQITTTADCKITSAVARFPGSFSCSHVLQHSPLEAFCSKGNLGKGHLIAHSGYPLHQWLLPPLQNPHTKADVRYNEALRQTHSVVGKTIRLLKARFPCLDRSVLPLQYSPKASARIILACCVLHNISLFRDVKLPGRSASILAELPAAQEDYNCESDEEALSDSEEIVALRVTAGQEKQAFTIQQFFA